MSVDEAVITAIVALGCFVFLLKIFIPNQYEPPQPTLTNFDEYDREFDQIVARHKNIDDEFLQWYKITEAIGLNGQDRSNLIVLEFGPQSNYIPFLRALYLFHVNSRGRELLHLINQRRLLKAKCDRIT